MRDDRSGGDDRLSPMQEGMLFHHLSGGPVDVDLQQIVVDIPGALDVGAFRQAWIRLLDRHAALRSSIVWGGGRASARVIHPHVELPLERRDLRELAPDERERAFDDLVREQREQGFDLERAPLFRLHLARIADDAHRLLWSFHHLVMDGRSTAIVLEELFEEIDAVRAARSSDLPEVPDYRAFLEALASRDASGDEAYWRSALAGIASATTVPGTLGTGARPAMAGDAPEIHERRLSRADTARLEQLCELAGVSLNALIQASWALLLSRFSGESDVVYGVTRAVRGPEVDGSDRMVGVLIQTHPVRVTVEPDRPVSEWLAGLKAAHRRMGDHWLADLADIGSWSEVAPGAPLFETLYMYDHAEMTTSLSSLGGAWADRSVTIIERPPYPITLYAYGEPELLLRLAVDPGRLESGAGPRILELLEDLLLALSSDPARELAEVEGLPAAQREWLLASGAGPRVELSTRGLVHEEILARGVDRADRVALAEGDREVTFGELASAVEAMAYELSRRGVGRGTLVGLYGDRGIETLTALLGVLAAGGAYVPLDPSYPDARLRLMVEDSGLTLLLAGPGASLEWGGDVEVVPMSEVVGSGPRPAPAGTASGDVRPDDLAYVIYTSGSTGRPKGVMLEHENVRNFLAGMDAVIGASEPETWLSVTPLSFDISVLELLWTLSRGWRVVLPEPVLAASGGPEVRSSTTASRTAAGAADEPPDFGLFYFAAASAAAAGEEYRLLLDGARKADRLGFTSVWTPERHFHAFGGLYPNPAVTGAAVAAVTERLSVRAGSVVIPLHDPIRVAEEWSVVDHLTGGRAGVAFASGWQKNDFVFAPDRYEDRHEEMFRGIDIVQRLWRGEEVFRPGVGGESVGVRLHPKPIQPQLPMWLTAAGSPETFRKAGEIGAGVLTHLLGQSAADLSGLIGTYRQAWREAGHGPGSGHVVVMLHTFVTDDEDEARERVRGPLREYLRTSVGLIKNYSAVWASRRRSGAAPEGDEFAKLEPEDLEAILDQAFERYYETSGLLGSPEKCADLVRALGGAGVDEIACLIDFGVDTDRALAGIDDIAGMRDALRPDSVSTAVVAVPPTRDDDPARGVLDVPRLVRRHGVTHVQCTPSLVRLLLADAEGRAALASLDTLLVGGEAFPSALAEELRSVTDARIVNMYGPTETAVWSSTGVVRGGEAGIEPIGRPIANTSLYVLGPGRELLPQGASGELWIGGSGVARGYLDRPELTEERFTEDPFAAVSGARMYRTGDRVRWRADGTLEFLGRVDQQVKLRGHRIELGEIEATLRRHEAVADAAVVARGDGAAARLAAYVVRSDEATELAVIRDWLQERLPEVMVPAAWVPLTELPLTPNGKVDRNALPDAGDTGPDVGSGGDTVEALARIWSEVLGVSDVAPGDDFFELGGNSLSTIQVAFRIRTAFGVEIPLRTFFRAPTVAALARRVEEALLAATDHDELESLVAELEDLSDEEARRLVGRE